MSWNTIQFQKGLSLPGFIDKYGTETACRDALFKLRWPEGFRCPECGNATYCTLKDRALFQCHRCHHQASLTTRTLFEKSKLPLTTWFLAIFLLTQSKTGLSALALGRPGPGRRRVLGWRASGWQARSRCGWQDPVRRRRGLQRRRSPSGNAHDAAEGLSQRLG